MKKQSFPIVPSILLLSILLFIPVKCLQAGFSDDPWDKVNEILARIIAPEFPDKDFNITDFGAIPDGQTDCRSSILDAISACHKAGGGRVIIPAGDYISEGPLLLKSNVNLHLQEGAYLKFGINPEDYLTGSPEFNGCVKVRWEGLWCYNYSPIIYAWKEKNIAITGKGTIDGQTDKLWSQWYIKRLHQPDRLSLRKMGMDMVPVVKRIFGDGHHLAPGTIELYHCQNVLIEGICTKMPLERTIHPTFCDNVIVRNVNIQAGVRKAQNDDGIDPDSSSDVLIEGCTFYNFDDGIALKSGRAREGWPENGGRPTENVIIRNNIFHGEHNGVSVGSDMSGGVRNIFVYDCQFGIDYPQQYVFNAKSNSDRGGIIENIYFKDISVGSCKQLIRMEMEYKGVPYDAVEHPFPPIYREMYFENIHCGNVSQTAISIVGLEQQFIEDIYLINVRIKDSEIDFNLKYVKSIYLKNVTIH
jgi:polygalacturonase